MCNEEQYCIDVQRWIPPQRKGRTCDNVAYLKGVSPQFFELVKARLLNIDRWAEFTGKEKAEFSLVNALGEKIERVPMVGDLIRVKLPLIQNIFGSRYDWVEIVKLDEIVEYNLKLVRLMLRPTQNPHTQEKVISHFLDDDASNTLILAIQGAKIQMSIHGRNEVINMSPFPNLLKCLRNQFVSRTGFAGLNSHQWQNLVDGLLDIKVS